MSWAIIRGLVALGIDVLTVMDADMRGHGDPEQLAFALSQGRVLFSYNIADFERIHAAYMRSGGHHAGIILAHQNDLGIGETIRRLTRIVRTLTDADMVDRVVYLSNW
jgi:hypothetical protein